jgi:hypothetical protein
MLNYVPSLLQVIVVELIGAFFLSVIVATVAARHGVIGCPADPEIALGPLQISVALLGVVMFGWTLYRILWPRMVTHGVYNQVRLFLGNLRVTIPTSKARDITFPPTHPAYAAVEVAMFCYFVIPLLALGARGEFVGCSLQYSFVLWWTFVPLLLALPVLRVIAWYVLRRRYPTQEENVYVGTVAKVVYWPLSIMVPCAVILFGSVLLPPLWAKRVDAASFAGGLSAHPALEGEMVRLRGTLASAPVTCSCAPGRPRACSVADARLDLGSGGEVIVRGLSDFATNVQMLADQGIGREVTAHGKLTRNPKPARTSVSCPPDPFPHTPGRPRAYLEFS